MSRNRAWTKSTIALNLGNFVPFISKGVALAVTEGIFALIKSQLEQGQSIELGDIGILSVKDCASRLGFDPVKKVRVEIPAKKRIRFKQTMKL